MCFHQRERPPSRILAPNIDAIILSGFPFVWFFGFLYYTEVPSVLFVVGTVVAAMQNKHWLAALVRLFYLSRV
jgi:alpha-1,2-glucosyltransferase